MHNNPYDIPLSSSPIIPQPSQKKNTFTILYISRSLRNQITYIAQIAFSRSPIKEAVQARTKMAAP